MNVIVPISNNVTKSLLSKRIFNYYFTLPILAKRFDIIYDVI